MIAFLYYPIYLVLFWYKDILGSVFIFFIQINRYAASILSVPQFLKTYFKPVKNEYRDGLILFSIILGIVIKSFLLVISILILLVMLLLEVMVLSLFILMPIIMIYVLIIGLR